MTRVYHRKRRRFFTEPTSSFTTFLLDILSRRHILSVSHYLKDILHNHTTWLMTKLCPWLFESKIYGSLLISEFIHTYKIDPTKYERLPHEYQTLQDYFQRRLKLKYFKPSSPNQPNVLTSPTECRLLVFPRIQDATTFWIKGENFNISTLLKSSSKAPYYTECSIVICRLAVEDYHRFHFPTDGKYTKTRYIRGSYLPVKPVVVRHGVDVFVKNRRTVTYLQTRPFGDIAIVCVGAACVGSVNITSKSNQRVKKGDEYGTFAFGGSTVILLIPKGRVRFDRDILTKSQQSIETFVSVGDRIGRAICHKKRNTTSNPHKTGGS